jgi:hypothetical protein
MSRRPPLTSKEFADRFFDRQRTEILDRIRTQSRPPSRHARLGSLAAAALLAALMGALVLDYGPQRGNSTFSDLRDTPALSESPDDPLVVYGEWGEEAARDGILDAFAANWSPDETAETEELPAIPSASDAPAG